MWKCTFGNQFAGDGTRMVVLKIQLGDKADNDRMMQIFRMRTIEGSDQAHAQMHTHIYTRKLRLTQQ